jgi:hypothetical protein
LGIFYVFDEGAFLYGALVGWKTYSSFLEREFPCVREASRKDVEWLVVRRMVHDWAWRAEHIDELTVLKISMVFKIFSSSYPKSCTVNE